MFWINFTSTYDIVLESVSQNTFDVNIGSGNG